MAVDRKPRGTDSLLILPGKGSQRGPDCSRVRDGGDGYSYDVACDAASWLSVALCYLSQQRVNNTAQGFKLQRD